MFIYGLSFKIDASPSIDEGSIRLNLNSDPLLLFNWICPAKFDELCKKFSKPNNENRIIEFPFSLYSKFIKPPLENEVYDFTLILTKDKRINSRTISATLKKPLHIFAVETKSVNNNPTDVGDKDTEMDITDLIVIEQNPLGKSDIVFKVSLLDPNIDMLKYRYNWNIIYFKSNDSYINGKNEISLRVKYEDLLNGLNDITIIITNPKNNKIYSKTYQFEKGKPPFGGNCQVNPQKGFSLATNFTFTFENWKSNLMPLLYKIKFENKNKILVDLTEGGFFENKFVTNALPAESRIFLEVIDNQGFSSQVQCNVIVQLNKHLKGLDSILENYFEESMKLIIMEIYQSNKKEDEIDPLMINKAVDMVETYFDDLSEPKFLENYEIIVSTIITISKNELTSEKINKIYKILNLIMMKIDKILSDLTKIEYLYTISDILNKNAEEYLKSILIKYFY